MKRISIIDIYPYLFAIFPIIALSSHNLIYVNFNSTIRSLLLAVTVTIILVLVLSYILKDRVKANLLTSGFLLLFFSYGQVFDFLVSKFGEAVRHRYLSLVFLVIFGTIVFFILRAKSISVLLPKFLTYTAIALTLISIIPIISFSISNYMAEQKAKKIELDLSKQQNMPKPDIYVIILDSYTRADVLERNFKYDNSPFLDQLKQMGFYVADCSQSNYPSTRYSVSSLMMGNYIQDINPDGSLVPFSDSFVIKTLRSLGYSVYSFENWSKGHFDLGEDKLFTRNSPELGLNILLSGLNEFESMLMKTTFLRLIVDMPQLTPWINLKHAEYEEHFLQVKYTFSELPKLPAMTTPKFVFVHILVPHEPYIFTPDGQYNYVGSVYKGYPSEISFLSNNLPAILKTLINDSKIPPVIILQGDHGANMNNHDINARHSILNAYYVNDPGKKLLYPTITPVNSFRVIFDAYFNADLNLIQDKSYYAYNAKQMTDQYLVPNKCVP